MKKIYLLILVFVLMSSCVQTEYRRLAKDVYLSKMKAGWLGQMAGVGWGAPTEFKFNNKIIPLEKVPQWESYMLNQQYQDDIYVEMTFLRTIEEYGFDVSIRQAGIDFANSRYMLWHANKYGRDNLREGIAPPFSGHPKYNAHADDIDYQIEADYSGLISPGLPQNVIELGEKFGRLMNYGDGLYGGQFVGAMYAEAFFEQDILKIIEAGLACIPAESQYSEAINDVIKGHQKNPDDWKKTWKMINEKYHHNPQYRKFFCAEDDPNFNIDAKINGAYIVMGLLYGKGNMDSTIVISMRCGMDSDCNPSNAAGILATSLGMKNLPAQYKTGIDDSTNFSFSTYNFSSLLETCNKLARDAVVRAGGKLEKNSNGIEEYIIPIQEPELKHLEQSWDAKEISGNVNYTPEEMKKITIKFRDQEDFVNVWNVAGPFSKKGVEGLELFNEKFAPETNSKFSAWKKMPGENDGYATKVIELDKLFKAENSVAYLKTNIWSEKEKQVFFEIGSDDGVKLWLNDKIEHQKNILRGHMQGEDKIKVTLDDGWNVILMKVTQGLGGWGASLVITDLEGEALRDLKYSLK